MSKSTIFHVTTIKEGGFLWSICLRQGVRIPLNSFIIKHDNEKVLWGKVDSNEDQLAMIFLFFAERCGKNKFIVDDKILQDMFTVFDKDFIIKNKRAMEALTDPDHEVKVVLMRN